MLPTIILAISAVVRLIHFGSPATVVFDEVHNGFYLNAYWTGQYFFDVHPPLAKIFTAIFGVITGANHAYIDWTTIGNVLPTSAILIRILPLIAGIILPVIIYGILRQLKISTVSSFTASMLVVFENSLVVQSRFILYDEIMLAFGFVALYFYFKFRSQKNIETGTKDTKKIKTGNLLFWLAIMFSALALSIKWTGLSFLALIGLMETYRLYTHISTKETTKKFLVYIKNLTKLSAKIILPSIAIYFCVFAFHFWVLPHSGSGDAFMSESFNKSLLDHRSETNDTVTKENILSRFVELNTRMFSADQGLTASHPYSSKWYTWPLMIRPIFYWEQSVSDQNVPHGYIYYLGNPIVYWLGIFAIIILATYWLWLAFSRKNNIIPVKQWHILTFILFGFALNFLPFVLIGRVMFLYHYETALIFGIFAIAMLLEMLTAKKSNIFAVMLIIITVTLFVYFAPLSYGTTLSSQGLENRMWLSTWR